jgi:hypothetical protein
MLPRANKNCIKVNIDGNDDEEDIQLKMDNAKRHNGFSLGNMRAPVKIKSAVEIEQMMDIEEPFHENVRPRKTESHIDLKSSPEKKIDFGRNIRNMQLDLPNALRPNDNSRNIEIKNGVGNKNVVNMLDQNINHSNFNENSYVQNHSVNF